MLQYRNIRNIQPYWRRSTMIEVTQQIIHNLDCSTARVKRSLISMDTARKSDVDLKRFQAYIMSSTRCIHLICTRFNGGGLIHPDSGRHGSANWRSPVSPRNQPFVPYKSLCLFPIRDDFGLSKPADWRFVLSMHRKSIHYGSHELLAGSDLLDAPFFDTSSPSILPTVANKRHFIC